MFYASASTVAAGTCSFLCLDSSPCGALYLYSVWKETTATTLPFLVLAPLVQTWYILGSVSILVTCRIFGLQCKVQCVIVYLIKNVNLHKIIQRYA